MNENKKIIEHDKYPKIIGIPISNICNGDCDYCLRQSYILPSGHELMDEDHFVKLIDKVKNKVPMINISAGYGEALLHPLIDHYLDIAHKNGVKILLYTNGVASYDKMDTICSADTVVISANRPLFDLDKNREIIQNGANIIVSVLFDLPQNNTNYLYRICTLCHEYHINIELKCVFNYNNIPLKDKKTVSEDLKMVANLNSPYIHIMTAQKHKYISCTDPWKAMYFDMEGFLRPCCIYYDSIYENNIFKDDLCDIWNSTYLNARREQFENGIGDFYCKECPIGYGNVREYDYKFFYV